MYVRKIKRTKCTISLSKKINDRERVISGHGENEMINYVG